MRSFLPVMPFVLAVAACASSSNSSPDGGTTQQVPKEAGQDAQSSQGSQDGGTAGDGCTGTCPDPETDTNADFYLSPTGSDDNDGSRAAPFKTLMKLWTVLSPGKKVLLRGGTYKFTVQQYLIGKSGTANAPIKIWAYPGERPILSRDTQWEKPGNQWHRGGIVFTGDYFHFKGFEVTGFVQVDQNVESGMLAIDANHNTFERLDVHHNGSGFYLERNSTENLILNSDFHHNYDPLTGGGNADGLALAYVSAGTTNTVRGCRAYWNSDDGFDTFENSGYVLIEDSWAWNNGYVPGTFTPSGNGVGFKLGSVFLSGNAYRNTTLRTLIHNVAYNNRDYGFHQNEGEFRTEFFGNTSYKNVIGGLNFHYENLANTFKNNVSFGNGNTQVEVSSNSSSSFNSCGVGTNDGAWAQTTSDADFLSVDPSGIDGPRQANGSLPTIPFLHLAPGSDLIDKGTNIGRPFNGAAPDLGAFER
ncbi:MAG: right-handed parallel beta-helix repeat-containing protein [Polyangiaceae bacterium]